VILKKEQRATCSYQAPILYIDTFKVAQVQTYTNYQGNQNISKKIILDRIRVRVSLVWENENVGCIVKAIYEFKTLTLLTRKSNKKEFFLSDSITKVQEASLSNRLKNRLAQCFHTFYIAYMSLAYRQHKIHVTVYDRKSDRRHNVMNPPRRFRLKVGCCLDRLSTVSSSFNGML